MGVFGFGPMKLVALFYNEDNGLGDCPRKEVVTRQSGFSVTCPLNRFIWALLRTISVVVGKTVLKVEWFPIGSR